MTADLTDAGTARLMRLEQVSFAYEGQEPVVRQVSLAMGAGSFHCLIGRSGCGKTTLLKLAAGLLSAQSGQVFWRGLPVTGPSREMGFVFQTPTLLDWLSVLDNVLLPMSLHGTVRDVDRAKALQLLEQMGLASQSKRQPQQLSGGQQSRVAIARALVTSPNVLFMDEPFAALDAITRSELQHDLLALCQQEGTSVLFVTHDIAEAVVLADHVSVMHAGRISTTLAVNLPRPRQPGLRYTADFTARCAQLRQALEPMKTWEPAL